MSEAEAKNGATGEGKEEARRNEVGEDKGKQRKRMKSKRKGDGCRTRRSRVDTIFTNHDIVLIRVTLIRATLELRRVRVAIARYSLPRLLLFTELSKVRKGRESDKIIEITVVSRLKSLSSSLSGRSRTALITRPLLRVSARCARSSRPFFSSLSLLFPRRESRFSGRHAEYCHAGWKLMTQVYSFGESDAP